LEIFKDIKGLSGKYQVSNKGRIKSFYVSNKGRIMKPEHRSKRYLCIGLRLDLVKKNYVIHRLVANAFIDNPENKPQINHKDGVKTNNHIENLEWCTKSENMKHSYATGLQVPLRGANNPRSLLNQKQVNIIKAMKGMEIKQKEIAILFNVHSSTVSAIYKNRTYIN
jgi:hypothetical protein